ncbi:TldD/PmbA family protein [archaeon]|jgi:TldD protein|nr:TldD/PmbA family protein [archaeon]
MNKDLADFSIKYLKEKGVDYAEARLESKESNSFMMKDGNLEASSFDQGAGLGIRFLINNNLGFLAANKLDKVSIKAGLDKALRLTKRSARIGDKIELSSEPISKKSYKVKQKKDVRDIGPDEKIKILTDLDKATTAQHKYFSLSDHLSKKYYINSEGSRISSEIPRINFFYLMTLIEGDQSIQRMNQYGSTTGYESIKNWKLENNIQNEMIALKKNMLEGIKAPTEKIDVICAPEVTGIATHESCGHPYEADRMLGRESAQAGESFVTADMIGHKIGFEGVSVVDDPTLLGTYGFYLYDDEGVKARKKVLMKDGIINEFLHNRDTAAQMGYKSNGSSRANNFSMEPIVRMSNTFITPGKQKEEELIKDVKKGIYLKSFMEWNIDDKRYQQKYVGSEAYLIEKGELTKPVKSPKLEITTPAFWSSIDGVGSNLKLFAATCGKGEPMQGIPVTTGGPSIRLRGIKLR